MTSEKEKPDLKTVYEELGGTVCNFFEKIQQIPENSSNFSFLFSQVNLKKSKQKMVCLFLDFFFLKKKRNLFYWLLFLGKLK